MLTEIWGTWIVMIRDSDDVPPSYYGGGASDKASARRIHRPVPRHRPASK